MICCFHYVEQENTLSKKLSTLTVFLLQMATFLAVFYVSLLSAAQIKVDESSNLQLQLDLAENGDEIVLSKGTYLGNFIVSNQLSLVGEKGAVIDAQGKGHALLLQSSHVKVKNLTIVNWGSDLTEQNAGIYSDSNSSHIFIENNKFNGDGFGIWLQKTSHAVVHNNHIVGNAKLRSADRGNGIQLSSVKESTISGNETSHVRDGIYVQNSQNNVIEKNIMHDLRYGVHYMYSHTNKVIDNTAYNTRAGYALMSSRNLIVEGNTSDNSQDYGFLMNFITSSTISNNLVRNVWTNPENKVLGRDGKGLFIYNSAYNTISHNLVETAEIGIHLTAGSEGTKVYGNSFINNPIQVKYVSNKKQEWSLQGQGNYWSNYLGWDMNSDQVGDVVFEPNDGIDKLLWQFPEMKMLMDSPAVIILRWVQRQFPVLKPPGVKDSFPLMHSPHQQQLKRTANTNDNIQPNAEQAVAMNLGEH